MRTAFRVLIGFIVACIVAGLTVLLFVHTPTELLGWLSANDASERWSVFGVLWMSATVQTARFAALFALIGVVVGEWLRLRDWTYYAIGGIVIAGLGFVAQWLSEPTGQNWSVVNSNYPLVAFLTTGFVGGFAYWMSAGRHAGGRVEPIQESA